MPKARFAKNGSKKPKPKSQKTTAKLSAKRKLSRMGKKQKRGHAGIVSNFITRTRAIKKLQITLRDFRRLCILKGVYPRDPKKKASGTQQTYYHVKDIKYLAHEPLLDKFRHFKAFMKKVRRAAGRQDLSEARRIASNKPTYTLHHLIVERYPRFTDALADMDDALSMVHMFASLPAEKRIQTHRTELCLRLCREWQNYVVHARVLQKVFISVKGVYYQAVVQGIPITWVVPHRFNQAMPSDVDYRIMLTFLEFYEAMLQFVFFKLYHSENLRYPPPQREDMDAAGAHLAVVDMAAAAAGTAAGDDGAKGAGDDDKGAAAASSHVRSLPRKLRALKDGDAEGDDDAESGSESESDSDEEDDEEAALLAAGSDEEAAAEVRATREAAREQKRFAKLFKGLVFFLSREVPRENVEFVIRSLGGEVGWQGPGSAFDETDDSITHHVTDRPGLTNKRAGREYVQPQWVFDSVNARLLLPVHKYAVDADLPPHLSPFVDDTREGYIPAYRTELDRLRVEAGLADSVAVDDVDEDEAGSGSGSDSDDGSASVSDGAGGDDGSDAEAEASAGAGAGAGAGASPGPSAASPAAGASAARLSGNKRKRLSGAGAKKAAEAEKRQLQEMMLGKKRRRMYDSVMRAKKRESDKVSALREKRVALATAAAPAGGADAAQPRGKRKQRRRGRKGGAQ